jgi:site-specific recombinase XerD
MLNTGARVQEVLDLRIQDVRIEPPYQVRLRGNGNKIRVCPIWAHTARRVRQMLEHSPWPTEPDRALFLNLRGEKLTRFGVYQLLKKRIGLCSDSMASLRGRRGLNRIRTGSIVETRECHAGRGRNTRAPQ